MGEGGQRLNIWEVLWETLAHGKCTWMLAIISSSSTSDIIISWKPRSWLFIRVKFVISARIENACSYSGWWDRVLERELLNGFSEMKHFLYLYTSNAWYFAIEVPMLEMPRKTSPLTVHTISCISINTTVESCVLPNLKPRVSLFLFPVPAEDRRLPGQRRRTVCVVPLASSMAHGNNPHGPRWML